MIVAWRIVLSHISGGIIVVRIQMLGTFLIETESAVYDNLPTRSRRGVNLIRFLVLQRGKPTSVARMNRELEGGRHSESPENALKTLVSRTRTMLNEISRGLGACIVSEKGAYRWENLPGVEVDVLLVMDILERLERNPEGDLRRQLTEELLKLYRGDIPEAYWLHREFLDAVYAYIEQLKDAEEYNHICEVCDAALEADKLDERLHVLRMEAMVNLNRSEEALNEYQKVARHTRLYYDEEPGEEMQECYKALLEESQSLKFNLDVIHNELVRDEKDASGPYFCDYRAFKEIYNLQIRNLERLGSSMFLGVVMLGSNNSVARESGMAGLHEILRCNLRRGDIVTRFNENVYAMLLPTVNYNTGSIVMERLEQIFYAEYPSAKVTFHSRVSPIGGR